MEKLLKTNGYPTKFYVSQVLIFSVRSLMQWINPIACYYPEIGKAAVVLYSAIRSANLVPAKQTKAQITVVEDKPIKNTSELPSVDDLPF